VRTARRNLLLRRALYRIFDPGRSGTLPEAFRLLHHALVVLGVGALVLGTVPRFAAEYGTALDAAYYLALAFFAVEYLCRLYVVPTCRRSVSPASPGSSSSCPIPRGSRCSAG
jgi:hypothetical protein